MVWCLISIYIIKVISKIVIWVNKI
jgi:hypothetical protein